VSVCEEITRFVRVCVKDNRLSPMSVLQQAEDMMASVIRLLLQQVVTVATPGLLHVTAGTIGHTHCLLLSFATL
jgi:uncharacterized hydantoinase/oxoprolinase family protein